jgi:hypothetical protein
MNTTEKVLMVAIGIFVSAMLGYAVGKNNVRQEALLNGHGVYVYGSDGMPNFKWNECIQF